MGVQAGTGAGAGAGAGGQGQGSVRVGKEDDRRAGASCNSSLIQRLLGNSALSTLLLLPFPLMMNTLHTQESLTSPTSDHNTPTSIIANDIPTKRTCQAIASFSFPFSIAPFTVHALLPAGHYLACSKINNNNNYNSITYNTSIAWAAINTQHTKHDAELPISDKSYLSSTTSACLPFPFKTAPGWPLLVTSFLEVRWARHIRCNATASANLFCTFLEAPDLLCPFCSPRSSAIFLAPR